MVTQFSDDATPAYKGYRRQALYTLSRILAPHDAPDLIFHPEGTEDLAILDSVGRPIEIVQVKDYGTPLTVSSFSPEKPGSFFERTASALRDTPDLTVTIASFGAVGPELARAIAESGSPRATVVRKLVAYGRLSSAVATNLLDHMRIDLVEEATLVGEIYARLRDALTGVDPEHAFDLLTLWLYTCAEERRQITRADAIAKINQVGNFLAARAAHHREWFTSIVPIDTDATSLTEPHEALAGEFYRGVPARYEHVLADLDIRREQKLQAIAERFTTNRVVVIHGASGQGKTTLAYRYLHEHFPAVWRFQVRAVENRQHALSIAAALAGHADALELPLAIYLDVAPSDSGWPELVARLTRHPRLRVLVTIREEDWRRASTIQDEPHLADIGLDFAEDEARELYAALAARETPAAFSGFDDAWQRFGAGGPLLEFTYLVTQGESLRQRLRSQLQRLQDEVCEGKRAAAELTLLRLVSVAGAYEARLMARPLAQHLKLAAPARTIELLEREYLLHQSAGGALIQGLHPVRSAILAELFDDPTFAPWAESASACLPFIHPPDIETFLLSAFARRPTESDALVAALAQYRPTHWAAIRGIIRALLWLGLRDYVEANRPLLQEAYADLGESGFMLLDFDIADAIPGSAASLRASIGNLLPPARRELLESFRARQTDKRQALAYAKAWLGVLDPQSTPPMDTETWAALGETLFWYGRLGVTRPSDAVLPLAALDAALDTLPIAVIADLVFGLFTALGADAAPWLDAHREQLLAHFRRDTQTVIVEDDGQKIAAHFVIELDQMGATPSPDPAESARPLQQADSDPLHDQALLRIDLLRKLAPDRELYASQGYGHQVWAQPLPYDFDNTRKTGIPRSSLPPLWLTQLNAIFRGLSQRPRRPADWPEYAQGILALRQQMVRDLLHFERQIDTYFKRRTTTILVGEGGTLDAALWQRHKKDVANPPLLPLCALDEWGFFDESSAIRPSAEAVQKNQVQARSWALRRYSPFLTPFQEYTRALANFYEQSLHVMLLNPALGRGNGATTTAARTHIRRVAGEAGINDAAPRLSMHHLLEAVGCLATMQHGARALLASFLDPAVLARLEQQERTLFARFWTVWYWFAFHPRAVIPNATQECPRRAADLLRQKRNALRRAFDRLSTQDRQIQILSETVPWSDAPALWVTLDCADPAAITETLTAALGIIRETLGGADLESLQHFVLQWAWSYCVMVPQVRGKLLEGNAWPIHLSALLREDGLNWIHGLRQAIPQDVMTDLDLHLWSLPRLAIAARLLVAAGTLLLLIGHLRHLNELPDLDDLAFSYGQDYIQRVVGQLGTTFQAAIDAASEMRNQFNALSPTERAQRPHLLATVQALAALHDAIPSELRANGQVKIALRDLIAWADTLDQAQQHASDAYHAWAADVLDEQAGQQ